jgi:hypothetical protein
MTHGKDVAQRTQTMFEPGYTEKVVNYCSGVAYTYKDVAHPPEELSGIDGPGIGDRAPDVDFERGGALFDRLRHTYFTLLAMPEGDEFRVPAARLTHRFGPVLHAEVLPASDALSARYGASDGRCFLVRPDGYVAFKCRVDQVGLLEAHLGGMLTL